MGLTRRDNGPYRPPAETAAGSLASALGPRPRFVFLDEGQHPLLPLFAASSLPRGGVRTNGDDLDEARPAPETAYRRVPAGAGVRLLGRGPVADADEPGGAAAGGAGSGRDAGAGSGGCPFGGAHAGAGERRRDVAGTRDAGIGGVGRVLRPGGGHADDDGERGAPGTVSGQRRRTPVGEPGRGIQ